MSRFLFIFVFLLALPKVCLWAQAPTADQYLVAGQNFYAAKDYKKAFQYFQAAAQLNPNSVQTFQGLGNSEYMLGQKSQALLFYQKALALNPNNPTLSAFIQNLQNQLNFSQIESAPVTSAISRSGVEIDLMGGFDEPVSPGGYALSFDGGGEFYFSLNRAAAIGIALSLYSFSYQSSTATSTVNGTTTSSQSGGGSATELEGLVLFKLRLSNGNLNPYVLVGAGLSDYNDVVDGSVLNPVIGGGLGLEFNLRKGTNLFLEGKTNAILASNTTIIHIPIDVGINFEL